MRPEIPLRLKVQQGGACRGYSYIPYDTARAWRRRVERNYGFKKYKFIKVLCFKSIKIKLIIVEQKTYDVMVEQHANTMRVLRQS